MGERGLRSDAAVSDLVGTLLLVALVVALGSVLAVVVTANVSQTAPAPASFSMGALDSGATDLAIAYRNGEPLLLDALEVRLARGDAPPEEVPREAWTTPDADVLSPGDRLVLPLAPPAADGEAVRVVLARRDANALLGELRTRAGDAAAALGTPVLAAAFTPAETVADGVTATRLEVRVSHPAGALLVARVSADLSSPSLAAGAAPFAVSLNDAGEDGDAQGGDGVWSALVRLPSRTPLGDYDVPVNATDATGRQVAALAARVGVYANATHGPRCIGCDVRDGVVADEGTRLHAPASASAAEMRLRSWSVDPRYPERLAGDSMLVRVLDASGATGWSAYLRFDREAATGMTGLAEVRAWSAAGETVYVPRNGTLLPLSGLDLDLLDPVASLQLVRSSGAEHPQALYPAAGVPAPAAFVVATLRDEGARSTSLDQGLHAVEVVLR